MQNYSNSTEHSEIPLEMDIINADIVAPSRMSYTHATNYTDCPSPANQPIDPIPQTQIEFNVNKASFSTSNIIEQQNGSQRVVIIQQQNMLPLLLGSEPAFVLCPACNVQNVTRIEHVPHSIAPLLSCFLCIAGAWCCFCFPYICNSCMNAKHFCSNCNQYLGTFDVSQRR